MPDNNGTAATKAQRSAAAKKGVAAKRRQTARRRSTTAQSAARSAATRRVSAEKKQADALTTQVTGVAESAVLIPVGVALETRDRVLEVIRPWTSRTGAERELNRVRRNARRFERRGSVARNRALREARRRRTRVLGELRRRRRQLERIVRGRRVQANRVFTQNGRRMRTELRKQSRETQARADRLRTEVEKAVRPGQKQTRQRVQQLV